MERKNNKQPKLHIRKGDTVKVIAGDDKGKEGKVLEIAASKNRAVVEGINVITKHQKPSAGKPEGGIKKTEASIHISNLMLVDPASGNLRVWAVRQMTKENYSGIQRKQENS
jgi:large subunit ribosomal protein L24